MNRLPLKSAKTCRGVSDDHVSHPFSNGQIKFKFNISLLCLTVLYVLYVICQPVKLRTKNISISVFSRSNQRSSHRIYEVILTAHIQQDFVQLEIRI